MCLCIVEINFYIYILYLLKKRVISFKWPHFLGLRTKYQQSFAVNSSTCSCSFQFNFSNINLLYKKKVT